MLMDYLKAHRIEFKQAELRVNMWACTDCEDEHVLTQVVGPGGVDPQHFDTVPDALHYLLHLAAELAANGRPQAWEFAHYLTAWVMVAVHGKDMTVKRFGGWVH